MTDIAPHITAFLRQRLEIERAASPHTRDTYAYAFQLLFDFASRKLGVRPSALKLEELDAPLVLEFLEDLQKTRGQQRTNSQRPFDGYQIVHALLASCLRTTGTN